MTKEERRACDAHIDNIMVQNDVLDTARQEGKDEGLAQGLAEGRAEGRAEGLTQGLAEGKAEQNRDNALKMMKAGVDPEIIRQVAGLTPEDL